MLPIDHRLSPTLKHHPLRKSRVGHLREVMYAAAWHAFVKKHPEQVIAIFHTTGPVRQRAASVAASFMQFMGTLVGQNFTKAATQAACATPCVEDAFMATWAIENKRQGGSLRTIEYILATEYPLGDVAHGCPIIWEKVPVVTMDDIDIVESMVRWWSTDAAIALRERVEGQYEMLSSKKQVWARIQ